MKPFSKQLQWNTDLYSHVDELTEHPESNPHCNQDGSKVKLLCWKSKAVWPCGLVTGCFSFLHRLSFLLKAVNWSEAAAENHQSCSPGHSLSMLSISPLSSVKISQIWVRRKRKKKVSFSFLTNGDSRGCLLDGNWTALKRRKKNSWEFIPL